MITQEYNISFLQLLQEVSEEREHLWKHKVMHLEPLERRYRRFRNWKATRTLSMVDIATVIAEYLDDTSLEAYAQAIIADGHWPYLLEHVQNIVGSPDSLFESSACRFDITDTEYLRIGIARNRVTENNAFIILSVWNRIMTWPLDREEVDDILGPQVINSITEGDGRMCRKVWGVMILGLVMRSDFEQWIQNFFSRRPPSPDYGFDDVCRCEDCYTNIDRALRGEELVGPEEDIECDVA